MWRTWAWSEQGMLWKIHECILYSLLYIVQNNTFWYEIHKCSRDEMIWNIEPWNSELSFAAERNIAIETLIKSIRLNHRKSAVWDCLWLDVCNGRQKLKKYVNECVKPQFPFHDLLDKSSSFILGPGLENRIANSGKQAYKLRKERNKGICV